MVGLPKTGDSESAAKESNDYSSAERASTPKNQSNSGNFAEESYSEPKPSQPAEDSRSNPSASRQTSHERGPSAVATSEPEESKSVPQTKSLEEPPKEPKEPLPAEKSAEQPVQPPPPKEPTPPRPTENTADSSPGAAVPVSPPRPSTAASGTAFVVIPTAEVPREYLFDNPDASFYITAAVFIGLICIITIFHQFVADYGHIDRNYVVGITFGGAALVFILSFILYAVTSGHYTTAGKMKDGLGGSFPCLLVSIPIFFVYVVGVRAIYFAAISTGKDSLKEKFLVFFTVPLFLVLFLPLMLFGLTIQAKLAADWRKQKGVITQHHCKRVLKQETKNQAKNMSTVPMEELKEIEDVFPKHRYYTSRLTYIGVIIRRFVVAIVLALCVSAHECLPFYSLGWAAYGLSELGKHHGYWTIACILGPIAVILIALAIIPATRCIIRVLCWCVKAYFYYPVRSWNPFKDGCAFFLFDNSYTYERMMNHYAYCLEKADEIKRGPAASKTAQKPTSDASGEAHSSRNGSGISVQIQQEEPIHTLTHEQEAAIDRWEKKAEEIKAKMIAEKCYFKEVDAKGKIYQVHGVPPAVIYAKVRIIETQQEHQKELAKKEAHKAKHAMDASKQREKDEKKKIKSQSLDESASLNPKKSSQIP